jgi:tripartite-type tricarboxylate transporter receptor subunit TctC
MIVTFPPAARPDATVRIVAPKLGERLGQQVVVDNRPGAGGNIGLAALAKSDPDGYTLAVGAAGGLAANAALYPKMPFDAQKDFVPISLLAHIPFVLVVPPTSSIKSVADLIAQAKAEPGKVSVGHGGNGTAMHLSVQLLKLMAQVDLTEIAYKGSGPVALDVIGGQVPAGMLDLPSVLQQIKAGKVRALAVTGSARLPQLPDVPTLAEAGVKGYESTGWFGVVAPAATPPAVVARCRTRCAPCLSDPEVVAGARAAGVELSPTTSAEFGRFIASETVKWADVIKRSGPSSIDGTSAAHRAADLSTLDAEVAIVGAGPVGLTLAIDLATRGRSVVVLETRARGEPPNVKCNHVAARTMEQFRRLGLAADVRGAGLPPDYPNDVAFRTSVHRLELSRIHIPARGDALQRQERPRRLVADARAAAPHQPDLPRADPVRARRGESRA